MSHKNKLGTTVQRRAVEFVQLPPQPQSPSIANTPSVHLTRQDGQKMTISNLNRQQLAQVVSQFIQPLAQEGL